MNGGEYLISIKIKILHKMTKIIIVILKTMKISLVRMEIWKMNACMLVTKNNYTIYTHLYLTVFPKFPKFMRTCNTLKSEG